MAELFEELEWTEVRRKWIMNIGKTRIPVEALNAFFKFLFTIICIALVFQIGRYASVWTVSECRTVPCSASAGGLGDMTVDLNCSTHNQPYMHTNSTTTLLNLINTTD